VITNKNLHAATGTAAVRATLVTAAIVRKKRVKQSKKRKKSRFLDFKNNVKT